MLTLVKVIPFLLVSLSTLPTTLSTPNPIALPLPAKPIPSTCPLTRTTYTTTITTTAVPCPTVTSTQINPCASGVTPSGCIHANCILLATSTVGCPGACCAETAPTTTETFDCSAPCQRGCGTTYQTSTVGCPS